jgi:hypothetical protein
MTVRQSDRRTAGSRAQDALSAVDVSSGLRCVRCRGYRRGVRSAGVELLTPAAQIDGDQAVTGVMVDNMLAGRQHYVFVAGQRYGARWSSGSAALYWALPLSRNPFTLRISEIA